MNQNQHKRSAFSGKIGFVLSAAGASVGLGNIWRFPYLAAKYGGGIFLLIYIILAFTFGYTMIVAETALGRMTRKSPVGAFAAVRKGRRSFGGWINAIIPRGQAGGYTMYLPEKDRSYVTKGEMFEDIVSSLGGRVAEQLILDDISTGASNDLQQATNIARQMITKYGFSERLGPVVYGTSQEETFLGRDLGQGKGYSETTAAEIDSEMRDIIDEAYETCRRTLTEHIDQLHALAQALMEREKLNEKEFNAVMAGETLPQREDPDAKPAEAQPAVQPVEQAETAEAAEPAEPAEAVDAAPQEAPAPETPDEGEANQ